MKILKRLCQDGYFEGLRFFGRKVNMGHLFKSWQVESLLVELGTQDYQNRVVRVWDYESRSIILDREDMWKLIPVLQEAIQWIDDEAKGE